MTLVLLTVICLILYAMELRAAHSDMLRETFRRA